MQDSANHPLSALRYHQEHLDHGPGTVYGHLLSLIGEGKRVLEAGPATGYLTRVLKERGCRVTCIEIDPEAARMAEAFSERMIVGNIEEMDLPVMLGEGQFDVAVFGDVLEHLIDPWATLRQIARVLRPDGCVVASLPNIAHGSVRMALMEGRFPYTDLGLLDRTHLRFFTMETLEDLFRDSGYAIGDWRVVAVDPFNNMEMSVSELDYPKVLVDTLRTDPESLAYQFVVRATPVPPHLLKPAAVEPHLSPVTESLRRLRSDQESLASFKQRLLIMDAQLMEMRALLHEKDLEQEKTFTRYKDNLTQLIDTLSSQQLALQDASRELASREAIIEHLTATAGRQQEDVQFARARHEDALAENAGLQQHITQLSGELADIRGRASYRALEGVRYKVSRLAPWGSPQAKLLSLPVRTVAYLTDVGLKRFLLRLLQPWTWLARKPQALPAPEPVAPPAEDLPEPEHVPEEIAAGLTNEATALGPDLDEILGWLDYPVQDEEIDADLCTVRGWALARYELIDRVEVCVDGKPVGLARLGLPRPDVKAVSDLPAAEVCGFQMDLDLTSLAQPGDYIRLSVTAYAGSGRSLELPPREVQLRDSDEAKAPILTPKDAMPGTKVARSGRKGPVRIGCFAHDLGYGGGQLYLTELIDQLRRNDDVHFVVIAPRDGPLRKDLEAMGAEVEVLNTPEVKDPEHFAAGIEALSGWMQVLNLDVVLANTLRAFRPILAAAQADIPSIWAIHESYTLTQWGAFIGIRDEAERRALTENLKLALRSASALIFESDATRAMYEAYAEPGRLRKITYGINTDQIDRFLQKFDRRAARQRLGFEDGERVIISMASFEPRKQLTVLSQAFAQVAYKHRDARLLLVGDWDCDYSTSLHAYIDEMRLGDRITTIPVVPDPFPWYALSDFFALISDVESMPRSLMESMYFGVPVLATDVFGVPEIVEDGRNGYLVPVNNVRQLAERLDYLLSAPKPELDRVVQRARKTIVEGYRSSQYARAYSHLIGKLAGLPVEEAGMVAGQRRSGDA